MDFVERVRYETEQNNMISRGDYVIAGVSGGADSVCLLCVLAGLRKGLFNGKPSFSEGEALFELSAVHVNHGIRGAEAKRDEEFVKKLCAGFGIELHTIHADVPGIAKAKHLSVEEAGRIVRQEAFADLAKRLAAKGFNVKVALAHHMDDRAETVLHNMMRGSALKGLAGISPVNELRDKYTIIRPLLKVRRAEIEKWLASIGQDFCTDSTNADDTYTRNRLRNVIIPMLEADVNSNAVPNIVQAADFVREAEEYISKAAYGAYKECVHKVREQCFCINISKYNKNCGIIKKYVVYYVLAETAGRTKDICAVHVGEVVSLADKKVGSTVNLPYSITAKRGYDGIYVSCGEERISERMWYSKRGWYIADKELIIERLQQKNLSDLEENDYTKCINYDKIKFNLQLRTRKEGDYISVYADGRTKKLKNYFIEQKIPAQYRDRVLLVADGSEIVWIVGFRVSESYKITRTTDNAVCLSINADDEF